jgi:hypothetical protein
MIPKPHRLMRPTAPREVALQIADDLRLSPEGDDKM